MKSRLILLVLLVVALLLSACDDSLEADNGKSYKDVPDDVRAQVERTTIVHLTIRVVREQITAQYQAAPATGSGSTYNSYGSMHYTGQIINGKGILLVDIINGPEEYLGTAILKFVDLKAMALQPDFTAQVSCVIDYELLNPAKNDTRYTEDALTYEFDDCRFDTPFLNIGEG